MLTFVNCSTIKYTNHAIEYIGKRAISESEVVGVIKSGEVIEWYDDKPFPSKLIFAMINERPLHIVVGYDSETAICFVITAYEPNLLKFDFIPRLAVLTKPYFSLKCCPKNASVSAQASAAALGL
jgi:hypothetical protein